MRISLWGPVFVLFVSCDYIPQRTLDVDAGVDAGLDAGVFSPSCSVCHGSDDNPAPPHGLGGERSTRRLAVGAHQSHLHAGPFRGPVACDECHVVPTEIGAPGHIGHRPAELTFGAIATADGASPIWDREQATCSQVYCHGATLGGGTNTQPIWTQVDGTQAVCGSCHGVPPPAPHPKNPRCSLCHPGTVLPDGSLDVAGGRHINGQVEVVDMGCDSCHGSAGNPAPPRALDGSADRTHPGVGAHRAHTDGGPLRGPLACEACHITPAAPTDPGHWDDTPGAEVTWGALSQTDGATPAYDKTTTTCAGGYCHGATLTGGTLTTPKWTAIDGAAAVCGACHGLPPAAPHPQGAQIAQPTDCARCHPGTVKPDGTIDVAGGLHIDGQVELGNAGCDGCHGSDGNPAPPRALNGAVDRTDPGVGAHRAHLDGGPMRGPLPCDACHVVPTAVNDPTHMDNTPGAELTFGALATSDGAAPAYDRDTHTCANAYCHGATLPGGTLTAPVWTETDGSAAACGACHAAPPPAPHPAASDCTRCHPGTVKPDGTIDVAGGLHINGRLDLAAQACDLCHGGDGHPAPPRALNGAIDPTDPGVGAHASHLNAGPFRGPVECDECHIVPARLEAVGHVDDSPGAEVSFGPLATSAGAVPVYDRDTHTCANAYCHGATLPGGTDTSPIWTQVDGTQAACGTCHGLPPAAPHPPATDCARCHPGSVKPDGTIDVDGGLHIDGRVQVAPLGCDGCHGGGGNPAPPSAVDGSVLTTVPGVGAHASHLNAGPLRDAIDCDECHVVPGSIDAAGHLDDSPGAELTFGPLATTGGVVPAYDRETNICANTYCHGATLPGGTRTTPTWTVVDGTQAACGTCHGAPPPFPHPAYPDCARCHSGTVAPDGSINVAGGLHIDGRVEVDRDGCAGCHGSVRSPAPPYALDGAQGTAARGVGAHQSHLGGGDIARPVACTACHIVPAAQDSPGHLDQSPGAEVTFSGLALTDGAQPTWDPATATCNGAYCHGATLSGGNHKQPLWTQVDGSQIHCGACHGNPPPAPHVPATDCARCHPGTVLPNGAIDVVGGQHIDGRIETVELACDTCHGTPNNFAPPRAVDGSMETDAPGVGAHAIHLSGSALAPAFPCETCHVVPDAIEAAGHLDETPGAELTFDGLALAEGSAPTYDPATNTCADTYCHGATIRGGTAKQPIWNVVDGSQMDCGSCHGNPPPAPHVRARDCARCHPGTVRPNGTIDLAGGLHLDGSVEVLDLHCDTCHGSGGHAAPPTALNGSADTHDPGVGAHAVHVDGGAVAGPMACEECHLVPAAENDPGHQDAILGAEVIFGPLAAGEGSTPAYDPATNTCANTYCHGASLAGGQTTRPVWTRVDGTQVLCDGCHANPPAAPHVQARDCAHCHPGTVLPDGTIDTAGGLHVDGLVETVHLECDTCHGGNGHNAPPRALDGTDLTSNPGVGAHEVHTLGGTVAGPMECGECHVVPDVVEALGHLDLSPGAELTFGALAATNGSNPKYDRRQNTCATTYCHGATLSGGRARTPVWTLLDGTQIDCGACHGNPPPAPHPPARDCARCHPGTVLADGTIDVAGGLHVDGRVQIGELKCDDCHGGGGIASPPTALDGSVDTHLPGVGAHAAHVVGGAVAGPVACEECHVVPATLDAPGHRDDVPGAELTFGALASHDGAAPTYDPAVNTCANTYCHGATLPGGVDKTPVWTRVDGSQIDCGSCHGNPPPAPHPGAHDCHRCHQGTVQADGTIDVAGGEHLDGRVETEGLQCDSCHGAGGDPAPPVAVNGSSNPADPAVGAHDAHLRVASLRGPIPCEECHVVPAQVAAPGHLDLSPGAELTFGALATTGNLTPGYDRVTGACANTYCHGTMLTGGAVDAPVWTQLDGTQIRCTACHGNPPPAPHPPFSDCNRCHPATVLANGHIDVPGGRHVDGVVEVLDLGCDGCHGSAATPAPPRALNGAVNTATLGVGAHAAHVGGGTLRGPINCTDCHVVPDSLEAPGHLDAQGVAEVTFDGLANVDGAQPSWDRATARCANTYCHGATLDGGNNKTPQWTRVDGSQDACGTCHGNPPPAPHVANNQCQRCHAATMAGPGVINVAGGAHMNGQLDVFVPGCDGCHGGNGDPGPPAGLDGVVDTHNPGVGAHATHLRGNAVRGPIPCTECHVVPADVNAPGHMDDVPGAETIFGALATTGGSAPNYNPATERCDNVYCHGATLPGGTVPQPQWTIVDGSQVPCDGCHGNPPPVPHTQTHRCSQCHPRTVLPNGSIDVAGGFHVNGTLEADGPHPQGWDAREQHGAAFTSGGPAQCTECHGADLLGGQSGVSCEQCHADWKADCTFCHGGRDNRTGAPPDAVDGRFDRAAIAVGAHTPHVTDTALHTAFACSRCHVTPVDALSAGHIDGNGVAEVVFSGRNAAAVYSAANGTCASTYCHGDGVIPSPVTSWTALGPMTCSSCHDDKSVLVGNTLRGQHSRHLAVNWMRCSDCHSTVANALNAIIGQALHVNGSVEVAIPAAGFVFAAGRCTGTCHDEVHSNERW